MLETRTGSENTDVNLREVFVGVWRRKWMALLIFTICIGAGVAVSLIMKPRWQATAQLLLIQRVPTLATTPEAAILAPIVDTPQSQAAMLQSDGMAHRTLDWLRNDVLSRGLSRADLDVEDEEQFMQDYTRYFGFDAPKDTNVLTVSTVGRSPQAAVLKANAVCQAFVAWKRDLARDNVREVTDSLQARLDDTRSQLSDAEAKLTVFKKSHQFTDVTEQQRALVDQYLQRDSDVQLARQDVAAQQARLQGLASRSTAVAAAIKKGHGLRDDAYVLLLQQQMSKLEMDRADAAQKYTADFPGIAGDPNNPGQPSLGQLDAQIAEVKGRLSKAVANILDNQQPTLQTEGSALDDYKQQQVTVMFSRAKLDAAIRVRDQMKRANSTLPATTMEYARLQRNVDIASQLFSGLKTDLSVLGSAKDMAQSDVQIAQAATVPQTPYRPNWLLNIAVATLLGMFIALGSALWLEQSDRRIRTIEDVKRIAAGPVVGTLPRLSRRQMRQMIRAETPPVVKEAYGVTRANMTFALGDDPLDDILDKSIVLVTSAVPFEGKSTTAAALARSLAQANKQVILVDADMRRPAQDLLFAAVGKHGLADLLEGKQTLDELLTPSGVANLTVLYSGSPTRHPSDLLAQPQLGEELAKIRDRSDVVVIDSPANTVVADALYLSRYADCILHVVRAGYVREDLCRESAETLAAVSRKPILFFVNRAPRGRSHTHRSYYTYQNGSGPRGGVGKQNELPAIAADTGATRSDSKVL